MPEGADVEFYVERRRDDGEPVRDPVASVYVPEGFLEESRFGFGTMDHGDYARRHHNSLEAMERYHVALPSWETLAMRYLEIQPTNALYVSGAVSPDARSRVEEEILPELEWVDRSERERWLARELSSYDPYTVFDEDRFVDALVVRVVEPYARNAPETES